MWLCVGFGQWSTLWPSSSIASSLPFSITKGMPLYSQQLIKVSRTNSHYMKCRLLVSNLFSGPQLCNPPYKHVHRPLPAHHSLIGCYTELRPFGEPTKGSLGKATQDIDCNMQLCTTSTWLSQEQAQALLVLLPAGAACRGHNKAQQATAHVRCISTVQGCLGWGHAHPAIAGSSSNQKRHRFPGSRALNAGTTSAHTAITTCKHIHM
jgi:hypothetical protein